MEPIDPLLRARVADCDVCVRRRSSRLARAILTYVSKGQGRDSFLPRGAGTDAVHRSLETCELGPIGCVNALLSVSMVNCHSGVSGQAPPSSGTAVGGACWLVEPARSCCGIVVTKLLPG